MDFRTRKIPVDGYLKLAGSRAPLRMKRHAGARRMILRIHRDGYVQLTLPPRVTRVEGLEFIRQHREWLTRQWSLRLELAEQKARDDLAGKVWFRGRLESVCLEQDGPEGAARARFADQCLPVDPALAPVSMWVERHLAQLGGRELPERVLELAGPLRAKIRRVSVRNQRTRWGSCSSAGTISLNWRLVQVPPRHRDYVIHHELTHLSHMDHSPRFWRALARVFPDYQASETWLKSHATHILD